MKWSLNLDNTILNEKARNDFNKARSKETFSKILNFLTPEKQELLSLQDVRDLIKPKSENYKGMKVVPISSIIGSEGRYRDFNKAYLPKHEYIRKRWENIDKAHISDIILPPIRIYMIRDCYFVRDGNHRVSVARLQGAAAIDAEVIELSSEIPITPDMTKADLKKSVIEYEKKRIFSEIDLEKIIKPEELDFTETGRFIEMLRHIQGYHLFLNTKTDKNISFKEAGKLWYANIYNPIIRIISEEHLIHRFPGRTSSDLYIWIIKHWNGLKKHHGENITLHDAALDYSKKYGKSIFKQIKDFIKTIVKINISKDLK